MGVCDSFAQDTIQVDVNDKARVTVTAQDRESLKKLKDVDFNKLIKGAIKKIDTTFREEDTNERTTLILFGNDFTFEGNKVKITKNKDTIKKRVKQNTISMDIGFSSYFDAKGQLPSSNDPYKVRILNSTYFGLGRTWTFRIGGNNSPVSLTTGGTFDWYNFKFNPQNYLKLDSTGNQIAFGNYQEDFGKEARKSKLVVSYFSIPIMWDFKMNFSKKLKVTLGVGGYAGIRLGGRTKVNLEDEKIKVRDSYYLNTWRYGLEGNIGINNTTLFVKYDLNTLFQEGKGPQLNPISVGIKL